MLSWIALTCLIGAVSLLIWLSVIDLKIRLLPNEIVLGFATLGLVFHLTTMAKFVSIEDIVLGGISGFCALFIIRKAANYIYRQDALGLGDVKLMGAGGIWLGLDGIMIAMATGALAAMVHGFIFGLYDAKRRQTKPDFSRLKIPAGPGFAVGIIIAAVIKFYGFPAFFLSQL